MLDPIGLPSSSSGETLVLVWSPDRTAAAASRRRYLPEGVVLLLEESRWCGLSQSASTLGVGLLDAMYTISGALMTVPSLGSLRPCHSLADFLLAEMGGGTLVCVGLGFWSCCRSLGIGCDVAGLPCGLPCCYWHEVGPGKHVS